MTSITHPKAQALIQAAADKALAPPDETSLNLHLAECEQCRQYARHLDKLQADLRRVTRYRWNRVSPQFSPGDVSFRLGKINARANTLRTVGNFSVAITLLVLTFVLAANVAPAIKSIPAAISHSSPTPEEPILTPTPSINETLTKAAVHACTEIAYLVQESDTLESIAARHSVSIAAIQERNGLASNKLTANTVLIISLCDRTPAGSTMTPTLTTTATP